MENAINNFEKYIDFWVKFKPSVADKLLFCIYKGLDTPMGLRARLGIAKGNLANCCKDLVKLGMIVQHTNGRNVKYELTEKAHARLKKFLEA
jgi:DNA-binding MarR family transcriptional regulator